MGAGASGVSMADEHPSDVFSRAGETWNEYLDTGSNEKYWNNVETGQSTFDKPDIVKLIEKERERDAVLFSRDEDLDEDTRALLKKADREATNRRMATVESMVKSAAIEDAKDQSRKQMLQLAKANKTVDKTDVEKRQALVSENVFAQDKLSDMKKQRLRVEAENEVQRFIDWLEMNRSRVIYEDQFSSKLPLELQFREILVKSAEDITEADVKKLRSTRQDLSEEWQYDDVKILMVQSSYRARKGKLHSHMVRQAKKAQINWGIEEREAAEERRRQRTLVTVIEDEKEAELELERSKKNLDSEHINKVLDELRAGGTLKLVGKEVGLAFEERARKDKLIRRDVSEIRGVHTSSLRHALRNGTMERKPRGHFEKLRLAQMLMSENTLRRCFLRWEETFIKNLQIREAMILALTRFFVAWKNWHLGNIKLKTKVASAIHNYYSMYVGHAFKRWWLRTRINFTAKSCIHRGVTVTYMERRDDFTVINSDSVKGVLIKRIFVNEHGLSKEDKRRNAIDVEVQIKKPKFKYFT